MILLADMGAAGLMRRFLAVQLAVPDEMDDKTASQFYVSPAESLSHW